MIGYALGIVSAGAILVGLRADAVDRLLRRRRREWLAARFMSDLIRRGGMINHVDADNESLATLAVACADSLIRRIDA